MKPARRLAANLSLAAGTLTIGLSVLASVVGVWPAMFAAGVAAGLGCSYAASLYITAQLRPRWAEAVRLGVTAEIERVYPLATSIEFVRGEAYWFTATSLLLCVSVRVRNPTPVRVGSTTAASITVATETGATISPTAVDVAMPFLVQPLPGARLYGLTLDIPPGTKRLRVDFTARVARLADVGFEVPGFIDVVVADIAGVPK